MRLSMTACAAAALALLMVKDASAQSRFHIGRAGTGFDTPRPNARRGIAPNASGAGTRRMAAPSRQKRLGSGALTRLAFKAAFGTPGGRWLTERARGRYRGRGAPKYWSAAYPDLPNPKVHIYLSEPDVRVATVEVKPRSVCVNGFCVMPRPNRP